MIEDVISSILRLDSPPVVSKIVDLRQIRNFTQAGHRFCLVDSNLGVDPDPVEVPRQLSGDVRLSAGRQTDEGDDVFRGVGG